MNTVEIRVNLNEQEAWQYAQFLKRVCLSDYEQRATSQEEAYVMVRVGERIQDALRQKGFAPR